MRITSLCGGEAELGGDARRLLDVRGDRSGERLVELLGQPRRRDRGREREQGPLLVAGERLAHAIAELAIVGAELGHAHAGERDQPVLRRLRAERRLGRGDVGALDRREHARCECGRIAALAELVELLGIADRARSEQRLLRIGQRAWDRVQCLARRGDAEHALRDRIRERRLGRGGGLGADRGHVGMQPPERGIGQVRGLDA